MNVRKGRLWAAVAVVMWTGACGEYDPPEEADPRDGVAAMGDSAVVPGADEPGPQLEND